jgi:hypothetical protein
VSRKRTLPQTRSPAGSLNVSFHGKSHCQTRRIGESKPAAHFKRPAQGTLHAHSLQQAIDSMIETQSSCSIIVPQVFARRGRNRIRDKSLLAVTGTVPGFAAAFTHSRHRKNTRELWQNSVFRLASRYCPEGATRGSLLLYPLKRSEQTRFRTAEVGVIPSFAAVLWLACDVAREPSSPRHGTSGGRRRKNRILKRVAGTPIPDVGIQGFCEMR